MNALSGRLVGRSIVGLAFALAFACGSPEPSVQPTTPIAPATPVTSTAPVSEAVPVSEAAPAQPPEVDAPSGSGPVFGKLSAAVNPADGCFCWEEGKDDNVFFQKTGAKKAVVHIDGKDYALTVLSSDARPKVRTDKLSIAGSNLSLDITWRESPALGEGMTYLAKFEFIGDGMVTSSKLTCGGSCM